MKNYFSITRIAADLAMIVLIAGAPAWFALVFAIACTWIFAPYYEIMLWGLAYDALYGFHSFNALIAAILIFAIIETTKKRTRI